MLMKQLLALKPVPVAAQALERRYEESSDFDAAMGKIAKALDDLSNEINDPDFRQHIKDTDENFGMAIIPHFEEIKRDLADFRKKVEQLYESMEEAS